MATLKQRRELINDATLHARIRIAAFDVAVAVLSDPTRANEHPFFQNIVDNPESWNIQPLVWEMAKNPAIIEKMITNPGGFSEDALDNDIVYVVTTAITKFSVPEPI